MLLRGCRSSTLPPKTLWIIRHGQAQHNPRAEAARAAGCSHEEFLEWMRRDDVLDADLTDLGIQQAQQARLATTPTTVDLVVTSPLSRALRTAELILAGSPAAPSSSPQPRVMLEEFREINGWLLNAKRLTKEELVMKFPGWDVSLLETNEDALWTPTLESQADCAHRGYLGLRWICQQPQRSVLLVAHGGILRFLMQQHPKIQMEDGRQRVVEDGGRRPVDARFDNCEVRKYLLQSCEDEEGDDSPLITLTEVDL